MAMKIPLLMGNGLVTTIETQICVSHMRLVGQRYRWKKWELRMAGFLLISLNSLK